jgi:hypothetical protein
MGTVFLLSIIVFFFLWLIGKEAFKILLEVSGKS